MRFLRGNGGHSDSFFLSFSINADIQNLTREITRQTTTSRTKDYKYVSNFYCYQLHFFKLSDRTQQTHLQSILPIFRVALVSLVCDKSLAELSEITAWLLQHIPPPLLWRDTILLCTLNTHAQTHRALNTLHAPHARLSTFQTHHTTLNTLHLTVSTVHSTPCIQHTMHAVVTRCISAYSRLRHCDRLCHARGVRCNSRVGYACARM